MFESSRFYCYSETSFKLLSLENVFSTGQSEQWATCTLVDAQSDLSLRWAHICHSAGLVMRWLKLNPLTGLGHLMSKKADAKL